MKLFNISFVISETKLDERFSNVQLKLNGYEVRTRTDRHKYRDGLIEFARKVFISEKLKEYEPNCSECICSEFTVSKKCGSVLVYIGLHQREMLKHSLKK